MGRLLLKALETEINKIKTEHLKTITKKILMSCSDENAHQPASSSGKYHPQSDLGEGGLIRHTKIVCRNIETIMRMWPGYDDDFHWDIPYISCILHDMCKYTEKGQVHSHQDHPLKMAEKIKSFNISELSDSKSGIIDNSVELTDSLNTAVSQIAENVSAHMSRWNTDRDGNEIGKLPKNMENAFCAIADMIGSQKFFKADFDEKGDLI